MDPVAGQLAPGAAELPPPAALLLLVAGRAKCRSCATARCAAIASTCASRRRLVIADTTAAAALDVLPRPRVALAPPPALLLRRVPGRLANGAPALALPSSVAAAAAWAMTLLTMASLQPYSMLDMPPISGCVLSRVLQ